MLLHMREWFRFLKLFLLLPIIAMFIWWAVGVWGGGMSDRREGVTWAAKVNGAEIPIATFQSYARQIEATYQSVLGEQYAQQRSLIHIGDQAINTLVDEELIHQEALRQGITASPREVAEAITRDPSLQENGKFVGLTRYRSLFLRGRMSVEDYEDQLRRGLIIAKFKSLVQDGVTVTDDEVKAEFEKRNAKQTVDYLLVDPLKLPARAGPSQADVARYYADHKDRYTRGEGRTGLFVLFGASDFARSEAVTDADVRAAYDRDLKTRFTTTEQRRASHILFKIAAGAPTAEVTKVEAKAREVLKKARAGGDFAALARTYSEDGSAKNGGDLSYFGRGQMVKEFEDAAFSLPVGGISDLVRTPYGLHIIKVTDTRAARTIPFEEARDSLREKMKLDSARAEAAKRATDLARAASGGKLEEAGKARGLAATPTGPVHDGEAIKALAASQPVVQRMMGLSPGDVSEPIAIPSGQIVVQVTGTVPPEARPLAEVRDRVEKDLTEERAREEIEAALRSVRRSGGGLQALARQLKVPVKTQADRLQGSPLPGVPPDPAVGRQLASLPTGALGDPIVTPAGIVVLSVRERLDHHELLDAQKDSIRDGLVRQRQDLIYRAFVHGLRERSRVVLNTELVRSLDRS